MAILIGTDFNDGIKGIGPKKSLSLIKKSGNIENVIKTFDGKNIISSEEINEIRKIFLKPDVTDDYEIIWKNPDKEKTIKILCGVHHFSKERIEPILDKSSNIEQSMKQKTLF
jgi:flap endonuclease-1